MRYACHKIGQTIISCHKFCQKRISPPILHSSFSSNFVFHKFYVFFSARQFACGAKTKNMRNRLWFCQNRLGVLKASFHGCLTGAGVIFNSFSFNSCRTIQICVSQMLPQLDLGAQFCRDYSS